MPLITGPPIAAPEGGPGANVAAGSTARATSVARSTAAAPIDGTHAARTTPTTTTLRPFRIAGSLLVVGRPDPLAVRPRDGGRHGVQVVANWCAAHRCPSARGTRVRRCRAANERTP